LMSRWILLRISGGLNRSQEIIQNSQLEHARDMCGIINAGNANILT